LGLFDFFKKKKTPKTASESGIQILPLDNGSHGDGMGGLYGFEFKENPDSLPFIYEQIDKASETPVVLRNEELHTEIKEISFDTSHENRSRVRLRIIEYEGRMVSAFPYVKTSYSIPFSTKIVHPWVHVGEVEAEIYGGGRHAFAVGFFATDYIANENEYKNNPNLEVHISAVAMVLERFDNSSHGELKLSSDFASYMPSGDVNRITFYDFIGKLVDVEEVQIAEGISGYLTRIKLINDDENPDFFTVDMFVNKQNMRISALEKGMSVTGCLWFQGEIKA
jgi:hypothetical protein